MIGCRVYQRGWGLSFKEQVCRCLWGCVSRIRCSHGKLEPVATNSARCKVVAGCEVGHNTFLVLLVLVCVASLRWSIIGTWLVGIQSTRRRLLLFQSRVNRLNMTLPILKTSDINIAFSSLLVALRARERLIETLFLLIMNSPCVRP